MHSGSREPSRSAARAAAAVVALLAGAAWAAPAKVVAVVPLGPVAPEHLETVAQALRARLDAEVRLETRRELPAEAFYAPRKRYRAEKLLDFLEGLDLPDAWRVVGVTEAEISTTKGEVYDWGIAGLGSLGGKPCVLSVFLYKKHSRTKAVLQRRLDDITAHEFGHTLGLDHCESQGCVMADARGKAMASADRSSGRYCDRCFRNAHGAVLKQSARQSESPGDGGSPR